MKRITLVHEDLRLTNVVRKLYNAINSLIAPGSWSLVHRDQVIIGSNLLFQTVAGTSGWIPMTDGVTDIELSLPALNENDLLDAYLCAGLSGDGVSLIGISSKIEATIDQGGFFFTIEIPGTYSITQPGDVNVQYPGKGTLAMAPGITGPVVVRALVNNGGANPAQVWGDITLITKVWRQNS